ncbi:MAG: outer membrane lipid asymmetry maintenance protein MlaD [Paracoccaceae bacterium]
MASNAAETLIGAVVMAVAIGFLTYASQFTSGAAENEITLEARFGSAEGLRVGSEVRLAGVRVGTLTSLSLDRATYQAVAVLAVDQTVEIPDDSEAKVASEGLLGGNFIELIPGGSPIILANGEEITYTQGAVSFLNLLMKFASGGDGDDTAQ